MNWMDMTLTDFQDALASKNATPGGGTAAAVALGQAAGLTEMVCSLTIGSEKWSDGWMAAENARKIASEVLSNAGRLANEDSAAFDTVVAAFRMPKSTDEEKETRSNAIRQGTLHAAKVPLETAQMGMELLATLESLAAKGNGNAASDVGVASLLASAAVKGALFNVEINVASLPPEMAVGVIEESKGMREACSHMSRGIMHAVHDRIQS
jgi:formiminotetrahydrofolate cyclodeaminase